MASRLLGGIRAAGRYLGVCSAGRSFCGICSASIIVRALAGGGLDYAIYGHLDYAVVGICACADSCVCFYSFAADVCAGATGASAIDYAPFVVVLVPPLQEPLTTASLLASVLAPPRSPPVRCPPTYDGGPALRVTY